MKINKRAAGFAIIALIILAYALIFHPPQAEAELHFTHNEGKAKGT